MKTVDVIIPTYKPGEEFKKLIEMLSLQTHPVNKLILMNTIPEGAKALTPKELNCSFTVVCENFGKDSFDHGKTRHEGILKSDAQYCLLMTQDAVPADEFLIENLISSFEDERVAVAYARQLPKEDCRCIERLSRDFNYPATSYTKTEEDIKTMGIKAFFCSDVCAMYDRHRYLANGGFIQKTIFNEDMIMANKLLKAGFGVRYCAEAKVYHSHNYNNSQQFHRNFDLGVSQADNPQVFAVVSSESEGLKFIKKMTALLFKEGKGYYVPYFYINSAFRLLGYKLGKNYKRLPLKMVKKFSMDRAYWEEKC